MVAGKCLRDGGHGWIFHLWDELAHLKSSKVEIHDLFPMWSDVQVVPGTQHPIDGYSRDVKVALDRLTPLVPRSHPVITAGVHDLRPADLAGDLVLIGGPVVNTISRSLHGYTFKNNKLSVCPVKSTHLRWCFSYPFKGPDDPSFSRYVNSEIRKTMPKAIMDRHASGVLKMPRFSKVDYDSGRICSDFLLVTVVPNTRLRSSTGSTIIDVADLQGQGDKVFADLLRDNDRRRELIEAVHRKRYFQALYELPVTHDDRMRETKPGVPRLLDVHIIS
jgi:hypothetical protein